MIKTRLKYYIAMALTQLNIAGNVINLCAGTANGSTETGRTMHVPPKKRIGKKGDGTIKWV